MHSTRFLERYLIHASAEYTPNTYETFMELTGRYGYHIIAEVKNTINRYTDQYKIKTPSPWVLQQYFYGYDGEKITISKNPVKGLIDIYRMMPYDQLKKRCKNDDKFLFLD